MCVNVFEGEINLGWQTTMLQWKCENENSVNETGHHLVMIDAHFH